MSKSKLKAHMLAVFRELEESGEELVVTDNNRPVLRIVPYIAATSVEQAFQAVRGRLVLHEDPDVPTVDEWDEV
ncbi:MAG: type II toxin-antitoxin system Phd/YefM family antitoxin [Vulcanimicrobiota bacterium]